MACTPEMFKVRFPEFADVDDARIQMFLDDATLIMGTDESRWCGNYDVSQCYLAAHFLAVANGQSTGDSGANGPISKQEVDDVIIEQAVKAIDINGVGGEYMSTSYGQRYLTFRKICFGAWIQGV